ncbi:MAG: hypothetical protein HZB18_12615 [Chloroflexi bacterium]|nr:hypothetical protein [Chloroflexota bacterium]
METLKKTLAVLCAILFVFTAVIALLLFNIDRKAFTAETYQKAFAQDDFYTKIPALMAEAIRSSNTDQSEFPLIMQSMSADAWEAFFRALLPPEMLETIGNEALNSTFAYLNMQTDSAQVNLAPLKAGMAGDAGVQAVFTILGTQPDCSLNQIAQMTLGMLSGGEIEFCNPPADLRPALAPIIQSQLQVAGAAIQDDVIIMSAPPQNDPRQRLKSARFFMRLSPILPLAFLLGLTLLVVRSLKNWLGWWGVPFFITGLLALVMGLLGAPLFGAILQRALVNRMPTYLPVIFLDYGSDLASAMLKALLAPILWQGLLLALLGLGMVTGAYFVKAQK